MMTYCLIPTDDGGRYVATVEQSPGLDADGAMEMDDPSLPDALRDPDLPLGCYVVVDGGLRRVDSEPVMPVEAE